LKLIWEKKLLIFLQVFVFRIICPVHVHAPNLAISRRGGRRGGEAPEMREERRTERKDGPPAREEG
jgi:hypothetical protein